MNQRINFDRLAVILFFLMYVFLASCSSGNEPEPFDCNLSDLTIEAVGQNPTSCSSGNGSITATVSGGKSPYKFAVNTGSFNTSPTFNNLGAGDYIVRVKDKNGCEASTEMSLQIPGADPLMAGVTSVADTECVDNNGSIEVNASGGTPPYEYRIGTGLFTDISVFNGLAPGNYSIAVRDDADCIFTKGVSVIKGDSQTSLSVEVKPIIEASCAITNCHNGSQSPDLRSNSNIISNAQTIKSQTQSGAMPRDGTLTSSQKALIACWVDEGTKNN